MSSVDGLGRALDDFGLEGDAPTSGEWGTAGVDGGGLNVDWSAGGGHMDEEVVFGEEGDDDPTDSPSGGNRSGIGLREASVGVLALDAAETVCGRRIGSSNRFCTRPREAGKNYCGEIKSHSKAKIMGVVGQSWFVNDGDGPSAYFSPTLKFDAIPEDCRSLISDGRRTLSKWSLLFSSLTDAESSQDVYDIMDEVDKKVSFKASPEKRNFESILDPDIPEDEVSEVVDPYLGPNVTPKKLRLAASQYEEEFLMKDRRPQIEEVLKHWPASKKLTDSARLILPSLEEKIADSQRKINFLKAEVGSRPVGISLPGVTLWEAVGSISQNPENTSANDMVLRKVREVEDAVKQATKEVDRLSLDLQVSERNAELARSEAAKVVAFLNQLPGKLKMFQEQVEGRLASMTAATTGADLDPRTAGHLSSEVVDAQFRKLTSELTNQRQAMKNLASRVDGETLQMGSYIFRSKMETTAWVGTYIADGDVCFMVDAISTLELMNLERGSFLGNLEVATQVGKTKYRSPTEAAVIGSFSVEVPAVFLDQSGPAKTKDTFEGKAARLLSTYETWTEEDMNNGVSYRISEFIEAFEEKTTSGLNLRYGEGDTHKAYSLLDNLARQSVDFIRRFSHWINNFYMESFKVSGNSEEAWMLTMNIVHGVCKELYKARQVAGNLAAILLENRTGGAAQVLWATLRCHKLMKDLASYNFSGHPRLAPYVLKHLAKHTMTKTAFKAEKTVLKRTADEALAKAGKAMTRSDQVAAKK